MRNRIIILSAWLLTASIFLPLFHAVGYSAPNSVSSVLKFYTGEREPGKRNRNMSVEVGDSTRSAFNPSFRINLWDGECTFKVDLVNDMTPFNSEVTPVISDSVNPITEISDDNGISYKMYKRSDQNFEWEIVIPSKPDTNLFEYRITAEGLRFYYQDSLDINDPSHFRPDSVRYSYAVYHDSERNDKKIIRGKDTLYFNYQTGKAFHIFRPRCWDVNGDSVWAKIEIDETSGLLRLEVPREFLTGAVYPITIDPTFGYSTIGGSVSSPGLHDLVAIYQDYAATGAGQCDSAYIYGYRQVDLFAGPTVKLYAYERTGTLANDDFIDSTARFEITATSGQWNGAAMVGVNDLANGVNYVAAFQAADESNGANTKLYYDNTYGDTIITVSDTDFDPPATLSGGSVSGLRYSIYVVYSTTAPAGTVAVRRKKIQKGNTE